MKLACVTHAKRVVLFPGQGLKHVTTDGSDCDSQSVEIRGVIFPLDGFPYVSLAHAWNDRKNINPPSIMSREDTPCSHVDPAARSSSLSASA